MPPDQRPPSPPRLSVLPVGGDVQLRDIHFETYNDPHVLLRLLTFSFLLLILLTAVYVFLSSDPDAFSGSITDLIFANFRGIVGMVLLVWFAIWCLVSWAWRIFRMQQFHRHVVSGENPAQRSIGEDVGGVPQRCAMGWTETAGSAIVCWVPRVTKSGAVAWELRIAKQPEAGATT